jgi:exodeoxyribonuclease-5
MKVAKEIPRLSPDQALALSAILKWFKSDKTKQPFITLGGFAGTGKTTLIAVIRRELLKLDPTLKVGFASYTGKAARVLRTKLEEQSVRYPQDTVGTIHSLIYSPVINEKEEIIGWKTKEKIDRHLIIIDEASMVDGTIWQHLLSYNVPLIVVGDHGQLPPIRGSFNLVENPKLRLEQIHRQAALNPIIGLSIQAREHGLVRTGVYSPQVIKYNLGEAETGDAMQELLAQYDYETLVLCGYNTTRIRLNGHIRQLLGFESPLPQSGDRVICLRNNHAKNLFNGMLGTINSLVPKNEEWYDAEIILDNELTPFRGLISVKQFNAPSALNFTRVRGKVMGGDLFDFGYALTVHKAQGSQARRVLLFEERFKKMSEDEWRRWLYTAITRAESELYIFARPGKESNNTTF